MINADKPHLWKADTQASVHLYNTWFLAAAPRAYRESRAKSTADVERALDLTHDARAISAAVLKAHPEILPVLRMSTSPPLARDRIAGLAYADRGLVMALEEGHVPRRSDGTHVEEQIQRMCVVINRLLDTDLFSWLGTPEAEDHDRIRSLAATVVADRLVGSVSNPIIRNAQEQRQLSVIGEWLELRHFVRQPHPSNKPLTGMPPGTYAVRQVVVVGDELRVNIPIDVAIQPHRLRENKLPLLVEAKSAGDYTNTNKRRKEEATKIRQLRAKYGEEVKLVLFLCGYFDSGYLGYEAAEGLDWVWEHRIDDFEQAVL